jgi:hypothetical protein
VIDALRGLRSVDRYAQRHVVRASGLWNSKRDKAKESREC